MQPDHSVLAEGGSPDPGTVPTQQPRRGRRKRRLLRAARWCLGLLVLAFLGAELFFRLRYEDQLRIRIYPKVYVPDEELGYRYRPDAEAEIQLPSIHRRFRINAQGFPSSHDYVPAKPPDTRRIAVIGSSNATGIWMDGQGQSYCDLLERRFREEGRSVEVMNFGIDGRYRGVHKLRLLEGEVASYEPDLVLLDVEIPLVFGSFQREVYKGYVMIYNGDSELSREWCRRKVDYITDHRFLTWLYRASYVVRAAARHYMNTVASVEALNLRIFIENRIQAPDILLRPYSVKKTVEAVQEARDALSARGGEVFVFQYAPNPYYRDVTRRWGLPYLEIDVPPAGEFVHEHDGHYSSRGHEAIAEQLHVRLAEVLGFGGGPIEASFRPGE